MEGLLSILRSRKLSFFGTFAKVDGVIPGEQ